MDDGGDDRERRRGGGGQFDFVSSKYKYRPRSTCICKSHDDAHTLHTAYTNRSYSRSACVQKSSSLLRAGHPDHGGMAPRIGKWVNTTPIMFDIGLIAELLAADGRGGTKLCIFERNFPALV